MKILVTGFEPFGGAVINPAYEAVKRLPDVIAGAEVIKIEIPTVFGKDEEDCCGETSPGCDTLCGTGWWKIRDHSGESCNQSDGSAYPGQRWKAAD